MVWGPNGSGKSGVIDALDFLLTGKMKRLQGEGTSKISLKQHGPHILADLDDAVVSAELLIGPSSEKIRIRRAIATPNTLQVEPDTAEVRKDLAGVRSGQFVLTRRDLLHFIAAEAGTRAARMKELMDVPDIDRVRRALVAASNQLKDAHQSAARDLRRARQQFAPIIGTSDTTSKNVLLHVNKARLVLGGDALPSLAGQMGVKKDLPQPSSAPKSNRPTKTEIDKVVAVLLEAAGSSQSAGLAELLTRLEGKLEELHADPASLRHFRHRELLARGRLLLGQDTRCPLCETEFPPGALQAHLNRLHKEIADTEKRIEELKSLARSSTQAIDTAEAALTQLLTGLEAVPGVKRKALDTGAREWIAGLNQARQALAKGVDVVSPSEIADARAAAGGSVAREARVAELQAELTKDAPLVSPQQAAWDTLTKIEQALVFVRGVQKRYYAERRTHEHAQKVLAYFDQSQHEVLEELYGSICERFEELYRAIHGDDEADFSAAMLHHGPSLDLSVGFYDHGMHPPQALHSEGHQDSMGMCLFLALAERLASGALSPLLLDDVVMSVDRAHRRQLARVLSETFEGTQFIITTHDRTWAEQLQTEGVVTRSNMIHFHSWDVTGGPRTVPQDDAWDLIDKDLAAGLVPRSAGTLRRTAEETMQVICDSLRAPVRFSLTGQWDLSDFAPAAISHFRDLIKQAKASANSWGAHEQIDALAEFESVFKQVTSRTNIELWAVNANVHYNSWVDFSEQDFRPVVHAFQDLFQLFRCASCAAYLAAVMKGPQIVRISCRCDKVAWNLQTK